MGASLPEIRVIESDAERKLYQELAGYCFKLPRRQTDRIFPLPEAESLAWGAFEGGALMAGIIVRRFRASIFGRMFPIAGIAWVESAPEARNRGLIRRLMECALRREAENGTAASALMPFSFRFYGSFGYGSLGPRLVYCFAPEELESFRAGGIFTRCDPADADQYRELAALIESRAVQYDFGIPDLPGPGRLTGDLGADNELLYFYRDNRGGAAGIIGYRIEAAEHGEPEMLVTRLAWSSPEGFRGLCEFIRVHRGQCSVVTVTLPLSVPLPFAAREPRLPATVAHDWMARPIDVVSLLEARAAVESFSGVAEFALNDPILENKSGSYRLEEGHAVRSAGAGDNPIPLQLFSSLLFGSLNGADAMLTAGTAQPIGGELFARTRRIWLTEEF